MRLPFGRGDDSVGNLHRAQIYQFELFELILLLKLGKQLPVEHFDATVSQSTVPSPPLNPAPCSGQTQARGVIPGPPRVRLDPSSRPTIRRGWPHEPLAHPQGDRRGNRNPRPQLEPQIKQFRQKCNIAHPQGNRRWNRNLRPQPQPQKR